jgi:threonine/homoserine/homoserine lactone efflux protein
MPVEPTTFLGFLAAATAVVISPGPDTLLIIRNTLSSGHQVGIATVVGVQLGLLGHTVLAVLGISVVIASSPLLFKMVAVLGAFYLIWIALQGLRSQGVSGMDSSSRTISAHQAIRDAVLTNVLNPKVILLFLALLPNFVDTDRHNVNAQLVTLALGLIVINVIWQAPLTWVAESARRTITKPKVQGWISRCTGGVLLLFAALMLWEHLYVR